MKKIIMMTCVTIALSLPFTAAAGNWWDGYMQGGKKGGGNNGGNNGGNAVPLDGGLSLLAAAGIGYAAKRKFQKKNSDTAK